MLPLNTFTLDPDSLVPERTSAVSSVVLPLVSVPVTVPTLSVAAVKFAVGAVVSTVKGVTESAFPLTPVLLVTYNVQLL